MRKNSTNLMNPTAKIVATDNYVINTETRTVTHNEQIIKVRPKTFQLLLVLITSPNQIIPKETFLSQVWDDVCVDEQVLFQSIKELRKVFSEIDAIKTFPRKGYSWVAPLHDKTAATPPKQAPIKPKLTLLRLSAFSASLLILLACATYFGFNSTLVKSVEASSNSSVIILPVSAAVDDLEHRWIRYGGMDQVIQHLKPSQTHAVWQVEDVLEMFTRAPEQQDRYSSENIKRIFDDSGAALIVEAHLAGVPGEYQIIYKLHQRHKQEKGVIFEHQAQAAFSKLAKLISKRTGQDLSESPLIQNRSAFANELLAVAIEQINLGNHKKAINYLRAIVEEEPHNLIARRHLAWSASNIGNHDEAEQLILALIRDLKNGREEDVLTNIEKKQLARIRFVQAQNYIAQEQYPKALTILEHAFSNAVDAFDFLYQGNIKHIMGSVYTLALDYETAATNYRAAAQYYETLQCPYGTAEMQLSLADIAYRQGKVSNAIVYAERAAEIAEQSNLTGVGDESLRFLKKIRSRL